MAAQLPNFNQRWIDESGKPTQAFFQAMAKFAQLFVGTSPQLINAANDGAAATAGVGIGQLYRNGSVVMIRVT